MAYWTKPVDLEWPLSPLLFILAGCGGRGKGGGLKGLDIGRRGEMRIRG